MFSWSWTPFAVCFCFVLIVNVALKHFLRHQVVYAFLLLQFLLATLGCMAWETLRLAFPFLECNLATSSLRKRPSNMAFIVHTHIYKYKYVCTMYDEYMSPGFMLDRQLHFFFFLFLCAICNLCRRLMLRSAEIQVPDKL